MHQYMIFTSRFTDPDPGQLVDCGSCYLVCPGASFPCVHCVYDLMGSLLGPRGDQLFVFTLTMTAATCPMLLLMFSVHSPVPHISILVTRAGWGQGTLGPMCTVAVLLTKLHYLWGNRCPLRRVILNQKLSPTLKRALAFLLSNFCKF